ncbi:MAG: hypothetical protein P4L87_19565 [Formivibrio sp.]|nr:hypothetical protein [Formivibrio sp.]
MKMKGRSYGATLLVVTVLGTGPLAWLLSAFVQDAFPASSFRTRFNPVWIGAIAAGLLLAILGAVICRSMRNQQTTQRAISARTLLFLFLALGIYNVFACGLLADTVERLIVHETSHDNRFYLTSAQRWISSRGCSTGVSWYDREINGIVHTCSTFALFDHTDGTDARRASIAHTLTGEYGVRVVSIHAIDSFFGQQDLQQMLKQHAADSSPENARNP